MGRALEFANEENHVLTTGGTFEPHPLLRNPHLATVVAAYWPRNSSHLPAPVDRLFDVEPGIKLLAKCHWQEKARRHPTLVLIHGFQGSSDSPYMLGTAEKAFQAGFNVLRMNQRNCGRTEHLTPHSTTPVSPKTIGQCSTNWSKRTRFQNSSLWAIRSGEIWL